MMKSSEKLKICEECEFYKASLKQCKICGCFMPAKVLLPFAKCPADPPKWE